MATVRHEHREAALRIVFGDGTPDILSRWERWATEGGDSTESRGRLFVTGSRTFDVSMTGLAQAIADAEERGEKRAAMSAEDRAVVVEALWLRHYELDRCDGCGGDCPSKMAAIERVLKGMGEVV